MRLSAAENKSCIGKPSLLSPVAMEIVSASGVEDAVEQRTESRSEQHLHEVRRRRRGLQARALAALQGEVLGEVPRSDVRQGGDFDLVHLALRRTDEEHVHVDRERSDAVQS